MPYPVPPAQPGRPRHQHQTNILSPGTRSPITEEVATLRPARSQRSRGVLRRLLRVAPAVVVTAAVLAVAFAPPAFAVPPGGATSLSQLIANLRNWLVGLLAAVATLFLTIGGLRYLTAGGDPGQVEKAKVALKSAAIGYALAALAPLLVSILASLVS